MRVNIAHDTVSKGLIFKKTLYRVTLDCQLSQEELQIIKEADLDKTVIMERGIPADRNQSDAVIKDVFHLTFYKLRKSPPNDPDRYCFKSPGEAKRYAEELQEQLKLAKEYLEDNKGIEETSTTLEL